MIKRYQLLCLWIVLLSASSYGQLVTQKMLVGKWYLIRHLEDNTLTLDLEDPELTVSYYLKQLNEKKEYVTRQDSVDLTESVYRTISGFENFFIEFREDGTYRNTKIKNDENEASEETEGGTYTFIPSEQKVVQKETGGELHTSKVSIRNKVLTMEVMAGKKKYTMEFRKR